MKDRGTHISPLRSLAISALAAALLMALGVGATPAQTPRALKLLGTPTLPGESTFEAKLPSAGIDPNMGVQPSKEQAALKVGIRFGVIKIEIPDGHRPQYAALAVNPGDPEWVRLSIEKDLEEEVRAGELRVEVANGVAFEINGLAGAYYKVPELERLKRDLGFPKDAVLAPSDEAELMRVHVQRTLDVSVETADYLMRLLGMEIDDTEIGANGDAQSRDSVSSSTSPPTSLPSTPGE